MEYASTRGRRLGAAPRPSGTTTIQLATQRQVKFIRAIGRECGMDDDALDGRAREVYGEPVATLTRRDASSFIEWLQAKR